MIRFNPGAREITLAVRDLIYFDALQPIRAEQALGLRARAGTEAHQSHRLEAEASGRADYQTERTIEYRLEERGYRLVVQGRIDGVYRENETWVVEEVKSVILDPARFDGDELRRAILQEGAFADYRMQLELYVLFLADSLAPGPGPASPEAETSIRGRLVLRNLAPGGEPGASSATVEITPHLETLRAWVRGRAVCIINRLEGEEEARAARRRASQEIPFPYPQKRPHQGDLAHEVKRALEEGGNLMVSAPTGIGKTAAVLHAALRHALAEGLKIFYATSKTTQQRLVVETLERMAASWRESRETAGSPPPFRAVVLRAREKICPNLPREGFIFCHEDFCRYARGFRGKVERGRILERLLEEPVVHPDAAFSLGEEAEVCPFELILEAALESDVIIGDYNYIFDPRSYLRRFIQERKSREAILIIDEAHNLYSRGRESHSPSISRRDLSALERWAREGEGEAKRNRREEGRNLFAALREWCRKLGNLFAALSDHGRDELGDPPVYPVDLDPAVIQSLSGELNEIRTEQMLLDRLPSRKGTARSSPRGRTPGPASGQGLDPLGDLASRWESFTAALEARERNHSLLLYDKSGRAGRSPSGNQPGPRQRSHCLRILCLNPALPLGRRIAEFRSAIAISATLEPPEFYRDVLGFPPRNTRMLAFPNPFPEENRKILVWNRISTYFRSRGRDASRVARLIQEISAVEPGNYLACFPSYSYLREVLAHISPELRERCVIQSPGMSEAERDLVLEALRKPGAGRVVLAVHGGIFTEGVDYPGEMLIGAIVVGPGLPAVTHDEERVREYFEDRYQQGFEYAYLYPGMNRVIQCAGRVIRSEKDVGVIVLLGERFSRSQYSRLFPDSWYRNSPKDLISEDLLHDLSEFWKRQREKR